MSTEPVARAAATRRRLVHAWLALLLLLATSAAVLHPFALDEHRSGEVCGLCLAHAQGGEAPLPEFIAPAFVPAVIVPPIGTRSLTGTRALPRYQARAPPV